MSRQINVLLSTFNSQKYLPQLLDSLLGQTYPEIVITVRDDGSTDETCKILQDYSVRLAILRLPKGERLGAAKSFLHLLANAASESDFYAFCDHDDVWRRDKLQGAVSKLEALDSNMPMMYFSRLEYVDADLKHLGYSPLPPSPCFANALVEDIVSGCTVVLNRAARDLVVLQIPQHVVMHDWWCYLVVSAMGKLVFDPYPSIRYRLHGQNESGAATNLFDNYWRRIVRWRKKGSQGHLIRAQVSEFASLFRDCLGAEDRAVLDSFLRPRLTILSRVRYAFGMDVFRQSWSDTMILRALILMGRV